ATLLRAVQASQAQATGFADDDDAVVLDAAAPALAAARVDDVAERWIFGGNVPLVREVHVGGRQVVAGGRHPRRYGIAGRYARSLLALLQGWGSGCGCGCWSRRRGGRLPGRPPDGGWRRGLAACERIGLTWIDAAGRGPGRGLAATQTRCELHGRRCCHRGR